MHSIDAATPASHDGDRQEWSGPRQTNAAATQVSTQNSIAGVSGIMITEKKPVCDVMLNHSTHINHQPKAPLAKYDHGQHIEEH